MPPLCNKDILMSARLVTLIILLTFFTASLFAKEKINKPIIDSEIHQFTKNKPVKAMIYGLWINGKPVSVDKFGDSMTAVPALIDMRIRAGGVTETMLTTILMKMVEQKKIRLEDSIAPWFPKLQNANHVTIRMLAQCTSGYFDYVYNPKFLKKVTAQPFLQWNTDTLLAYSTMLPPLFAPGTSQHYTHTDYIILSHILCQIAHKTPEALYQEYIFDPLQLHSAHFNSRTAEMPFPVLHSFSQDRAIYEDATFWSPSWTAGSGGVNATIQDLGKWANAWMNSALITEESTKILRAASTVGLGQNTKDKYFAMGFGSLNHWLIQNPRFGGYSGVFAVLPEKKIVFIAFNTLNPYRKEPGNISFSLWQHLATILAPEYPLPLLRS